MPVSQRGSQWEIYLLGLVQGEEFSTMRFCRVWFLVGLGTASWVENDVVRLLGMSDGSQRVGPREGKKCHAEREKWAFVTVSSKNRAVPGEKLFSNF